MSVSLVKEHFKVSLANILSQASVMKCENL